MIKLFLTIFISHLFASDSLLELASWSQAPERDIVKDQDAKFAILQSFAEAPGVQIGYRPGNPKRIKMIPAEVGRIKKETLRVEQLIAELRLRAETKAQDSVVSSGLIRVC